MRTRCERDIRLFAYAFFDHLLTRTCGPMHRDLFEIQNRALAAGPLATRSPRRLAIAAPRGAAKSTFKSLIFPLHATLYRHERYMVLVSATLKQARQRLRNIKTELVANALLREFYPGETAKSDRERWSSDGIALNEVQIDVFSAGSELRGISYRSWRPTLILLDDVENSHTVRSVQLREKLHEWYNEVIENLGDTATAIEIVGTLLHPDALLARLLRRPDYETRVYRSIQRFADRSDLWQKWRDIYTNLEDPDRARTARRFFNQNRPDMLRGAKVLWQAKEDYYDLMLQMIHLGRPAFFKEKQNEPATGEDAFFDMGRVRKFRIEAGRLAQI